MSEAAAIRAADDCLECRDLCISRAGRTVVRDVSFALRQGECLSLVGPNGSGKSTLLLALLGLIPVQCGTVLLAGRDLRGLAARERGRLAAYLPQLLERAPALPVSDVVAGGRYPHSGPVRRLAAADQAVVAAAIARCGLSELVERPFNTLSGGERQKTLLAAAIAQDPLVLLLDEPSTALDPSYQLELVHILRAWCRDRRSLLVVSHDLLLPAALGGRVLALREGRLVADGPAEQVLAPQTLAQIYGAHFDTLTTSAGLRIALPAWWSDPLP
jgi:iron complex transport system ATP-binding protein